MPVTRLLISGKVQGVFYRVTAKEIASMLLLNGWVRNLKTGEVEVMLSGNESQINQFIQWAWRGPAQAEVKDICISQEPDEVFTGFRIK